MTLSINNKLKTNDLPTMAIIAAEFPIGNPSLFIIFGL